MNQCPRLFLYLAACVVALLFGGGIVAWFYSPVPVEDFDSFTYCACGYSTVQFHDGKITMIRYPHPTVKPGQQIGTYRVLGDQVELAILFKGQMHRQIFLRDSIGLINPPAAHFPYRYCALNQKSPKTFINAALFRLHSEIAGLWNRI